MYPGEQLPLSYNGKKKASALMDKMCPSTHNRESRNKGYKLDSQNLICEVFHLSAFWNTCDTFNLSFCYSGICCRLGCSTQSGERHLGGFLCRRQNGHIGVSCRQLSSTTT